MLKIVSLAVLLAALLLAVVLAEAALNCSPQNGLHAGKCAVRRRKCNAQGIKLKFVGRGCRIGKVIMRDGGCQCDGYCGYLCPQRCNKDKQCTWNATASACYSKQTGLIGGAIPQCNPSSTDSPAIAPTASPFTTDSPVIAPTASPFTTDSPVIAPTASPTISPVIAPTASPSISPVIAPTASPSASPTIACFHRDSLATLESGETIAVIDLKYGDRVASFDPSTQKPMFSEVVAFSGYFPDIMTDGVRVDFDEGHLILSPTHVLYASLDGVSEPDFYMAKMLTKQSLVYGSNLSSKAIQRISQTKARGWITPLTQSGTIIVNGIAASCHTRAHYATRALYTPLYWYLSMFPQTKGAKPDPNVNNEHWYAFGVRRSTLGMMIADVVSPV